MVVPTDTHFEAVSFRLVVAAGRAQEEKGKAGTAYVLDELLQSGTQNFSREARERFLLSHGIKPKSTSPSVIDLDHTYYLLDIDEPRADSLSDSVALLADLAGNARFDEADFERSRKDVAYLAENRSTVFQTMKARQEEVLLKSSPYSEVEYEEISASLKNLKLADVKAYWENWYKADRMVLVVTGVVDSAAVEPLIIDAFAELESSETLVPAREEGSNFRNGGSIDTQETSGGSTIISLSKVLEIENLFERSTETDFYVTDFIGRIAESYAGDRKWLGGTTLGFQSDLIAMTLNVRGPLMKSQQLITSMDKTVQRLSEYGIAESALSDAKAKYLDMRNSYDLLLSKRVWPGMVADRAVRSIVNQIPFRYGKELESYLDSVISPLAAEEIKARCEELFNDKKLNYFIEMPRGAVMGANAINKRLKAMRKGYDFSWEQAGQGDTDKDFGVSFQSTGMVTSTEILRFEEYPVLQYEFDNRIRMNVIRSDAFPGRINVNVSIGNGLSELENANPAFVTLVSKLLLDAKLQGGAQMPTLKETFESKGIEGFKIMLTSDHLSWSAIGRDASDIADFFTGVSLWIVTGRLDEDAFDSEMEDLGKMSEHGLDANPSVRMDDLLFGEDYRLRKYFGSEDLEGIEFQDISDWLRSVRESGYIEITVVGDVMPRTVLRDVRKTFGASTERKGKVVQPRHGKPVKWKEAGVQRETLDFPSPQSHLSFVYPQIEEKSCIADYRATVFLPLLETHLDHSLADKPQLKAGVSVSLIGDRMVPLSNAIQVEIHCDSDLAKEAEELVLSSVEAFAQSLEADLLAAAKRHAWIELKRIARTPAALLETFMQAQGKPNALSCIIDLLENGFSGELEEYQEIATRQFSPENMRGAVLMPKAK